MKAANFEPPADRLEQFERDIEELRRQAREGRDTPPSLFLGMTPLTERRALSTVCDAVFDGSDGALLDGYPLPLRAAHDREEHFSALAAQCHREGGREALRRHHHRRMDDLLIAWCEELATIGESAPVSGAMAILRERQRLAPALAHLEGAMTPQGLAEARPTAAAAGRRVERAGAALADSPRLRDRGARGLSGGSDRREKAGKNRVAELACDGDAGNAPGECLSESVGTRC